MWNMPGYDNMAGGPERGGRICDGRGMNSDKFRSDMQTPMYATLPITHPDLVIVLIIISLYGIASMTPLTAVIFSVNSFAIMVNACAPGVRVCVRTLSERARERQRWNMSVCVCVC